MKQEIHIVMDLASFWKEPRLDVQFTAEEIAANAQHSLARENLPIIWKPDLYIYNLTHFEAFEVLDKLSGLSVYPDKTIRYYINVEIKVIETKPFFVNSKVSSVINTFEIFF